MTHAVIVLAHQDMQQLMRLIDTLDQNYHFYVHLDKRINKKVCDRLFSVQSNRVYFFRWRHVRWGGLQIITTQLRLVRIALQNGNYDYIHLASGQDLPIKNSEYINHFFEMNNGSQFMEYHLIPVKKWENGTYDRFQYYRLNDWFDYNSKYGKKIIDFFTNIQIKIGFKRKIPNQFPCLYGGSNWMSLSKECWRYIISQNSRSRKFLRSLRFTFGSDEVYFHTVVMNSHFSSSVVNNNLRLIKWKNGAVLTLTHHNIYEILISDAIFARKFNSYNSKKLLELLSNYNTISFNIKLARQILKLSLSEKCQDYM